ncbi:MAG TPA: polysaccharide deacetylase family protein [Acidimicrobiales bacterium]|nr:polysaccharide deacetylase family protein [Acidimicrobiales bacterium]
MGLRLRLLLAVVATVVVTATLAAPANARPQSQAAPAPTTLILYDTTGEFGYLGELYAAQVANLASHFGTWKAMPVTQYQAGQLGQYKGAVYLGSTYNEPIPPALLDDIGSGGTPVIWAGFNIWQLTARIADFTARYGWKDGYLDFGQVTAVRYKGTDLARNPLNNGGILDYQSLDPAKATVVAQAVRSDGTTLPWAVRSSNLTYIGELPFAYASERDRIVAFQDMLFDLLAPTTPTRHRALVRLEDVGPDADPAKLRAIADYLSSKGVPFSVATYARYRDPSGFYNGGVAEDVTFKQRPEVVAALKYMISKGGKLLMHGYTHQYDVKANPYNGVSGDDFEFFLAHVDSEDYVRLDGPVPEDSTQWFNNRTDVAAREYKAAGLPIPNVFEFPHYAGSATDYWAAAAKFGTGYDRPLYFAGVLTGGPVDSRKARHFPGEVDDARFAGQFFPYVVKDLYGRKVIPENIGDFSPTEMNHHPARLAADLVANARAALVVRDGFASFFYHPYLGLEDLKPIVEGIQGLGYTFVSADAV